MKKGVGSGVGSGYINQRYGSGYPDPHQNVTDPQHWEIGIITLEQSPGGGGGATADGRPFRGHGRALGLL
jgi:hypothetical protein